MPSMPPSSPKPIYQLYCGVDIAAKTFTAATCKDNEEPTKASNFKQSPQDYDQLQKHLLSSGVTPNQILVVMEATGTYTHPTMLPNCWGSGNMGSRSCIATFVHDREYNIKLLPN